VVTRWLPPYFEWNNLFCFKPKLFIFIAIEANFHDVIGQKSQPYNPYIYILIGSSEAALSCSDSE